MSEGEAKIKRIEKLQSQLRWLSRFQMITGLVLYPLLFALWLRIVLPKRRKK